MKGWPFLLSCVLGLSVFAQGLAQAPEPVAQTVLRFFRAKCAGCHGPHLSNPRSGFGYVLDLPRIAGNPAMVVPSQPDKSELWLLIANGEMPPPDSPRGPLTAEEKAVIRGWIAAGAPVTSVSEEKPGSAPEPGRRTLRWLGKFHLLLLHFPIALLLAGAAGELWSVARRSSLPSPGVRFCVGLAAPAAVVTAIFGWLYALGAAVSAPDLLVLHRWFGTATAVWAVAVLLVSELEARRGVRSWRFRLLLVVGVILVSFSAHLGGLLAHGNDFFVP